MRKRWVREGMAAMLSSLRQFSFLSAVCRLVLALAAGGLVGLGRAKKQRNAGLRTYMLTSVGAALTVLISMYEYEMVCTQWAYAQALTELKFDGTRFAAQVINGIGFLAAGTIIAVAHQQVSGLTSAIGLFSSACIGIAAGSGFYEGVFFAVVLVVLAMEAMKPLELAYKRRLKNINIYVEFDSMDDVATITDTILDEGAQLFDMDMERTERTENEYPSAILSPKLSRDKSSHSAILSSIAELPCVYSVQELIS